MAGDTTVIHNVRKIHQGFVEVPDEKGRLTPRLELRCGGQRVVLFGSKNDPVAAERLSRVADALREIYK